MIKSSVVSLHMLNNLFFSNLPQIHITTWHGRIISKTAKIRIGYGHLVCSQLRECRLRTSTPSHCIFCCTVDSCQFCSPSRKHLVKLPEVMLLINVLCVRRTVIVTIMGRCCVYDVLSLFWSLLILDEGRDCVVDYCRYYSLTTFLCRR